MNQLNVHRQTTSVPNGKSIDIYRPAAPSAPLPTVLLWHGIGPDEREVLRPLATAVAAAGVVVLVPDWRSDAPDGGRAHLLDSLAFCRERAESLGGDAQRITLAGWSAGAPAALGVALHPEVAEGWRPAAVVGLASRYDRPARTTGIPPLDDLAAGRLPTPVPVRLIHGTGDTEIGPEHSRTAAAALAAHDWPVLLEEITADHAGVLASEYDPALGRCRPSADAEVQAAGRLAAHSLAQAAGVVYGA
ncbi:alpha/beta hydrolase [Streptomyces orinoci]|uniref:Carboxylesterase family protein n=1 Tax=Streptomyces orinoci TaxID=67339 RepID=A0ABV3JT75_STRON|nr:carboxylesterase family protein [Streptomyces orinoci]